MTKNYVSTTGLKKIFSLIKSYFTPGFNRMTDIGTVDLASNNPKILSGTIYYFRYGKILCLSIVNLVLKDTFNTGTSIDILQMNSNVLPDPSMEFKSCFVAGNCPLHVYVNKKGIFGISNYTGLNIVSGNVIQGQILYLIK